jgi:hypothetical protein
VRLPRLVLIGAAAVCASVALLPAAAPATAAQQALPHGAATPGLAAAHFGHATGPAKARVVTGEKAASRTAGTSVNGYNWSGAVVTGSGFTSVTATWIEPSVTCYSTNDLLGIWVGLDGYGSSTVEQTGVAADCSSGAPVYQGWYEMYPAGPVYYSLTSFPVRPHDQITASVTRSGTTYTLKLRDSTRGWTKTAIASSPASNSSAEVVIESPTGSYPTFDPVTFTNVQINGVPLATWNPVLMDASANGVYQDHTSAVSGDSFSITYLHE